MAIITLVRHGQASFGAADYDRLSELGHEQSRALGTALGAVPARLFRGAQRRHRETLEGIAEGLGIAPEAEVLPGLNEFDFKGLLAARFRDGGAPEGMHDDHRTHFTTLRDTVLLWQRDEIEAPPERFDAFAARVRAALERLAEAGDCLAVSSGGAIGFALAHVMEAPPAQMIRIQLQMKNCAVSRIVAGRSGLSLHSFNEMPHIGPDTAHLVSYA